FPNVWIQEFVIQQPTWKIAAEILKNKPDVLGISVYIWNRAQSFELIERLQKQDPDLSIVVGGPEVSFDGPSLGPPTVIAGEGEKRWVEFLEYRRRGETPPEDVVQRWARYGEDLPELRAPYRDEDYPALKHRIAYIETSRGCPYLCSFCLSALDQKVRYFDEAILRDQIERLATSEARCIKFVDRTFNLRPARMQELMRWLTQFEGSSFHFEVVGDILTPALLDFLDTLPPGLFQFEIGIQSTTPSVQNAIQRKQKQDKLFETIKRLVEQNRIHIHCDLIFGLPGETLEEILRSFEDVLALRPHELQLGFLKFLPGAPIRDKIDSHGYAFQSNPPYELIRHQDLSAGEVIYLKKFTEVFDLFYNSRRFRFTLDHLLRKQSPVALFNHLLEYMESRDLLFLPQSMDRQYQILFEAFSLGEDPGTVDRLKLDYLYSQRVYHLPSFLRSLAPFEGPFRLRTWKGDRKTPVVPFAHEIRANGTSVELRRSPHPCYYAVVHPERRGGYLHRPDIHRVSARAL
nr:DUF4080 domain-containing protein [Nitrospinaceae bacterium]NIR53365.1 DUF4080 domain-containing protein [Nitrospinaceae bacterium]NIS83769.1 DUF4080 domain-containing protein [Nitrospinaceae bacterium]NIT80568.1 DUF4080 domain-containing protein [Nitrospinaceae bacterium]NIU42889.1 DUF4080 domain-containing protein [Nitrospinaceae bacterium]